MTRAFFFLVIPLMNLDLSLVFWMTPEKMRLKKLENEDV